MFQIISIITDYFKSNFTKFFTNIVVAVIILLVGFIIARIASKLIQKILHEIELNKIIKKAGLKLALEEIIHNFIKYFIYFITVIWALSELGLTTTVLNFLSLAVLVLIVISILLAIKDFIPNAFAGFMIYQKSILQKGNKISIDGIKGEVEKITLIETEIKTKTGDIIHIPNSFITKKKLTIKKSSLKH